MGPQKTSLTFDVFAASRADEEELAALHVQEGGVMAAYPAVPPELLLLAAFEVCLVVQPRIWWVIGSWVLHMPWCTWS